MNAEKFITSLYLGFLNRLPEEGVVAHLANRINSGTSVEQITTEILESDEFKQKIYSHNLLFAHPGHFYSPIVDPGSIKHIFEKSSNMEVINGLNINKEGQLKTWQNLLPHLSKLPFTNEKKDGFRYFFNNPTFGVGDASIYFSMLLAHGPKRIIEIGSGFSSACALDTVEHFFRNNIELTFVEPYPGLLESLLTDKDNDFIKIHSCGVQEIDIDLFKTLEAGDFLFIDSTHILKTCSDVHFELFEILPSLNPGVIIHIHDIFWPFEYPRSWVIDEKRSWNEIYALRAFLMYNDAFKIEFFNDYFVREFRSTVERDFPLMLKNTGGSIWLSKANSLQ